MIKKIISIIIIVAFLSAAAAYNWPGEAIPVLHLATVLVLAVAAGISISSLIDIARKK